LFIDKQLQHDAQQSSGFWTLLWWLSAHASWLNGSFGVMYQVWQDEQNVLLPIWADIKQPTILPLISGVLSPNSLWQITRKFSAGLCGGTPDD